MPLFSILLDRSRSRGAGVHGVALDPAAVIARLPAGDRAWTAWTHAFGALRSGAFGEAAVWLGEAEAALAEQPDPVCRAEVEAAWMDVWDEVEEPRKAVGSALRAWQCWLDLALAGGGASRLGSLRSLVHALAPDATAFPDDPELEREWLGDRLSVQVRHVFSSTVRLCGTLGLRDHAAATVEGMRSWMARTMAHVPASLRAAFEAEVLEDIGNLHSRLGESEKASASFLEMASLLEQAAQDPAVDRLRARAHFNAANELARMGEHGRADPLFAEAGAEFLRLGLQEPATRARHASLVSRFYRGDTDPDAMLRELEELIVSYEARAGDGKADDLRQNLDQAYRLWLTIAAAQVGRDELFTHRYLLQLFALREGLTRFVSDWTAGRVATARVVLSEIAVLAARLERHEGTVVLLVESGVGCILLATLRGGGGGLRERVRAAAAPAAFGRALEDLLAQHSAATDALIDRAIPLKSAASPRFMDACRAAWSTMPVEISVELSSAQRLILCPSNLGSIDEVPLELAHDGRAHLGLAVETVRAVSLAQLSRSLSDNEVNVARTGTALVVRAMDLEDLTALAAASPEVDRVRAALARMGVDSHLLEAPTGADFRAALGGGHDVFHYVGHGFADENGELLLLGGGDSVTAVDLMSLGPAPAPVCVASSCLLGRARHLRAGFQRGIVVVLLARGAPAIVAATEEVPDQLGLQFTTVFYDEATRAPLSPAMLATRRRLAGGGYHPAAWAGFAMFGDPRAALLRQSRPVRWPALLLRLAATGSHQYATLARDAVRSDGALPPAEATRVIELIDAVEAASAGYFVAAAKHGGVGADAEADLCYRLLLYYGTARFAGPAAGDDGNGAARRFLALSASAAPMLHDSYLTLATALVARDDLDARLTGDADRILGAARTALHWLAGDAELSATRAALGEEVAE